MPATKHRKCCILNGADREKGRGAMDWSTGSYISLVLLGRSAGGDIIRVEGEGRVKGVGHGLDPHPKQAEPKIPSSLNILKWPSPI